MNFEFYRVGAGGDVEGSAALNKALGAGGIVSIRKEFVQNAEASYWAFCIERVRAKEPTTATRKASESVDYKQLLSAEEFKVCSRLRELFLKLKVFGSPQRSELGMVFLGFFLTGTCIKLSRRSRLRYKKKLKVLNRLYASGMLSEDLLQKRLSSLTAFTLEANSWGFRDRTLKDFGTTAVGIEPDDSGRQLEQQRDQLPRLEPQRQRADEPQQQRGLPPFPQLRLTVLNGVIQQIEELTRRFFLTLPRKGERTMGTGCIGRYLDEYSKMQSGVFIYRIPSAI